MTKKNTIIPDDLIQTIEDFKKIILTVRRSAYMVKTMQQLRIDLLSQEEILVAE